MTLGQQRASATEGWGGGARSAKNVDHSPPPPTPSLLVAPSHPRTPSLHPHNDYLPAKSTRKKRPVLMIPVLESFWDRKMMNKLWLRLLPSFMPVAATARLSPPCRMTSRHSSMHVTYTSVHPAMYTPRPGSSFTCTWQGFAQGRGRNHPRLLPCKPGDLGPITTAFLRHHGVYGTDARPCAVHTHTHTHLKVVPGGVQQVPDALHVDFNHGALHGELHAAMQLARQVDGQTITMQGSEGRVQN